MPVLQPKGEVTTTKNIVSKVETQVLNKQKPKGSMTTQERRESHKARPPKTEEYKAPTIKKGNYPLTTSKDKVR